VHPAATRDKTPNTTYCRRSCAGVSVSGFITPSRDNDEPDDQEQAEGERHPCSIALSRAMSGNP